MKKTIPAISIIIPMYNTEKYIGECLESLRVQTFQDFEVIVVDDCTTDNSCAVVENYIPKFGGRLKLYHTEKNSGGPGTPSNLGVALSRGKYVYVIDNDDLLVNNALEILYNYAEKSDADVVNMLYHAEFISDTEKPFPAPQNMIVRNWQPDKASEVVTETENLGERVQNFCNGKINVTAWSKFIRRDFLIENEIVFPTNISAGADFSWTIEVLCTAEKILHISQPLYIYRHRKSSITHFNRENGKVNFWNEIIINGVIFLADFLSKQKFFIENPQYQFALLEYFETSHFNQAVAGYVNIPAPEIYSALKSNLKNKFTANNDLIAYLCTSAGLSHLKEKILTQRIIELENKLKQLQGG